MSLSEPVSVSRRGKGLSIAFTNAVSGGGWKAKALGWGLTMQKGSESTESLLRYLGVASWSQRRDNPLRGPGASDLRGPNSGHH